MWLKPGMPGFSREGDKRPNILECTQEGAGPCRFPSRLPTSIMNVVMSRFRPRADLSQESELLFGGAIVKLLYALVFRRRIESGTTNRWLDRLFFGRWFGPPPGGGSSYLERRNLRLEARDYDRRVRKARNRLAKLERKLGSSDPRVLTAKLEMESALAANGSLDTPWVEWDAKRHQGPMASNRAPQSAGKELDYSLKPRHSRGEYHLTPRTTPMAERLFDFSSPSRERTPPPTCRR